MGFLTHEPVADGAEENLSQPVYQWLRCSSLCLGLVLCTMFCELKCTFSDLSESDLERGRRMVVRKLTEQLTEELVNFEEAFPSAIGGNSKAPQQSSSAKLLSKARCGFLTVFDQIILGRSTAAKRDGPDVRRTRHDRDVLPILLMRPFSFEYEPCSVEEFFRSSNDGLWVAKRKPDTGWDSLPNDIQENILQRFDFKDLFRFKAVSTDWKKFIEGDAFRESRGAKSEGSVTAIHYYIKNQSWRCSGYDLHSKSWKALPPFSFLPPPDAELFKEYLVCGHGGLMCADVSKVRKGELVVFNPLTGVTRALPPLLYPRNPVLLHILVDSLQKSYKVIVAGSTASSQNWTKPDCKIMEVFDSSTSKWKETCTIPGPLFGLSKHQTGVIVNRILFFISHLNGSRHRRGDCVLAWDMENGRYLENWACQIPFVPESKSLLQLAENDGKVYLFSESKEDVQVPGIVWHRIDEMEFHDPNTGAMTCQWRNVVEVRKRACVQEIGIMYPDFRRGVGDFMCVGFGEGKLCIFNTLDRDGVVYDMLDGMQCEVLEPPPVHQTGDKFFSLNPASFTLHPSFAIDPG